MELERSGRDVDAEECPGIPVVNPDRRVQRQHVRRQPRVVHPRLYVEALEHNILYVTSQPENFNGVENAGEEREITALVTYLDEDVGLVGLAGAPEDEGEEGEEEDEQEQKAEVEPDVAAGGNGVVLVVGFGVGVGVGAVEALPGGVSGVFEGGGVAGGGGLARVVDGGAVVVSRVSGGAHWA